MAYVLRVEGGYGAGASVIQNDSTHHSVLVPDAELLVSGAYHRAGPDLVLTSPLLRAIETCKLAGLGERAQIDRDLLEWDYGTYEGLTPQQIRANQPAWLIFNDGCPGGESPEQVGARVDRVIARLRAVPGHAAVFAHGHVLRVFGARWLGLAAAGGIHFLLETATLCVLSSYHGVPAIKRWNAPLMPNNQPSMRREQLEHSA